jgi:cysteine-rich repeat protein
MGCSGNIGAAPTPDSGTARSDSGTEPPTSDAGGDISTDAAASKDATPGEVVDADSPIDAAPDAGADASTCGNGTVDIDSEVCDDGNQVDDDYCSNDCQQQRNCGDGKIQAAANEVCDDANNVTESCDYGAESCSVCDASCKTVSGATSRCGDGKLSMSTDEQCDDGNTVTEPCSYGANSCSVCNASCHSVAGATLYCGDMHIDAANGEQCDDGNADIGDGCDAVCHVEPLASCGNSSIELGETCDDGDKNNLDGCNAACKKETGWNCPTAGARCTSICGDTLLVGTEVCDDGNTVDSDYCSNNCLIAHRCGDSTVQASASEQCDDGNTSTETCAYGQTSCTVCNGTCKTQAGTTSYCGDGVVDTARGEECDVTGDMRCVSCKIVCDTIYITYGTTGSFQITDTTASLGNGTHPQSGGTVVMALAAGPTGPINGAAAVVYFRAPVQATTTINFGGTTTVTTNVVGTAGTPSNRCPLNTGTLGTQQVPWAACPYLGSHGTTDWTPAEQQVAAGAGAGCLAYTSQGTIQCSGPLCGAVGLQSGSNPVNDSWDQPMATFEFQNAYANVRSRALGGPAGGPGDKVEIPNNAGGRTWSNFDGVETARSCGLKPASCPPPGAQ